MWQLILCHQQYSATKSLMYIHLLTQDVNWTSFIQLKSWRFNVKNKAAVHGCSIINLFCTIPQNLQENTCAEGPLFTKAVDLYTSKTPFSRLKTLQKLLTWPWQEQSFEVYLQFTWVLSSRQEVLCKKGALRNFAKFSRKHLCQIFFFNKVANTGVLQWI